ncbi:MAG: hypothetical protein ABI443_13240 [Chthoniobacterales bacterium]
MSNDSSGAGKFSLKAGLFILLIIAGVGVGFFAAGIITYNIPRQYVSAVTIQPSNTNDGTVFALNLQVPKQFDIFQKKEILYPVIDDLNLLQKWKQQYNFESKQAVYSHLLSVIATKEVPNTELIQISIWDTDPAEAADIANAIGLEYMKFIASEYQETVSHLNAQINGELTEFRKKVVQARTQAEKIRTESGTLDAYPEESESWTSSTEYNKAKGNYFHLKKEYEAAENRGKIQISHEQHIRANPHIWQKAEPAVIPAKPNVPLNLALGMAGGAIVGFIAASALIILESLRKRKWRVFQLP